VGFVGSQFRLFLDKQPLPGGLLGDKPRKMRDVRACDVFSMAWVLSLTNQNPTGSVRRPTHIVPVDGHLTRLGVYLRKEACRFRPSVRWPV